MRNECSGKPEVLWELIVSLGCKKFVLHPDSVFRPRHSHVDTGAAFGIRHLGGHSYWTGSASDRWRQPVRDRPPIRMGGPSVIPKSGSEALGDEILPATRKLD